ncbi:sensor histidine kinase [Rhodopseudomonas telluris]|uniref:histidine kinase n=1 Tax=Rhodopseudomonas telluris TaxID=644215 RepID=A0ABV6EUF6_9BRAD
MARLKVWDIIHATRRLRSLGLVGDLVAVAAAALALLLRYVADPVLPPGFPYLTFFPAVVLTTFFFGLRAGVVCGVLSGLGAWYVFIPPFYSFEMSPPTAIALGFYVFIVAVDIALIHVMHLAAARLREDAEETALLYEQQRTMFQELQHRVANNMQFVSAMLRLYKKRAGDDPAAMLTALDDARVRLDTMSRIHRYLYDPANVTRPVGAFFQDLCANLLEAAGAKDVRITVDMPPVQFDLTRLTPLSLIVVEVITNALKHAFPDGRGTIALRLVQDGDRMVLTVADDGKGMAPGAAPDLAPGDGGSLGLKIITNLATQIGGHISYEVAQGTTARIAFDAA